MDPIAHDSTCEDSPSGDDPDPCLSLSLALDDSLPDPPDPRWLRDRLVEVAERLNLRRGALSVVVVADPRMSDLHRQYHNDASTTDVLTFDLGETQPAEPTNASPAIDGEIYICLDEARRQAESLGHDVRYELLLYAVHGLLHLLGYDDHDPHEYHRMHAREDELLEAVGVGRVFGPSDPSEDA